MSPPSSRDDASPPQIARLIDAFSKRDFAEVESLGMQLCAEHPRSAVAWKVLGTARWMRGDAAAAATALTRAAELAPKDADVHVNLGNALSALDRLPEAEQHLRRALKLEPQSAIVHASLGNLLRRQRRIADARASYELALQLQPQLVAARQNLAVMLVESGELEAAQAHYRDVIAADASSPDAWINLATLLQDTGRVREAQALLSQGLSSVRSQGWMLASLALTGCWMLGDTPGAANLFKAFQQQVASEEAARQDRALREFFLVSARLFDFAQREPALYAAREGAPLFVIGESHSLVPAHLRFPWVDGVAHAQPRLVHGVKMHHLARDGANGWKAAIASQLAQLPVDAQLMFTIGEIDCRADEGLWIAHQRGRGALPWLVRSTVDGYLAWLQAALRDRPPAAITLQGVPQPRHVPTERDAFVAMVADVNARLRAGCAARGWHFLDVHAATTAAEGAWHLDDFHLKPSFYAQALGWLVRA